MEGLAVRRTCSSLVAVSGGERGIGLESVSKPLIPPFALSRSISMGATANSINKSSFRTNSNWRLGQRRGLQTVLTSQSSYRAPSSWDLARSAGILSNLVYYRRRTQIERHLNSRPWTAARNVSMSAASGGTPPQQSFIGKLIEKLIRCILSLLPTKAIVEKVEEEVDAIAEVVKQGIETVIAVADEVENLSNIVEAKAEEVEKLAHGNEVVIKIADEIERMSNIVEAKAEKVETLARKLEDITDDVKKVVDDVADVLEGETVPSSLVDTFQSLKKEASATAAAAQKLQTNAPSGADDSGADTPTTSQH